MLLTATHTAPRSQADNLLAITEALPEVSLDVGEDGHNDENYRYTWFVPQTLLPEFLTHLPTLDANTFTPVDESIDYIAQTRASFPPLAIGPFFIARNAEEAPAGTIGLSIAPNRAFGSGEHATTTGCLLAYVHLCAERSFAKGLDFGAGSGILAIAAARQHGTPFVCVDNDEPSVAICSQNAAENGVAHLIDSRYGSVPPQGETYNLVFANILLTPLLENAEALKASLAPQGVLVLSGFTEEQGPQIEAAYTRLSLKKLWQHAQAGWLCHCYA